MRVETEHLRPRIITQVADLIRSMLPTVVQSVTAVPANPTLFAGDIVQVSVRFP
jgi:hypothetical protein